MKQSINIIISGGGTGGHIYPALAIANEIKHRFSSANILFVGAKDRMEMEKVPQAGFDIKGLWISGINRKFTLSNLLFPFKLLSSLLKASSIIKQFKPDIAIGTGGFASGPTLYVASKNKIPTLIQEQNSFAGITNKLLSKKANKICVAYDGMSKFFPSNKIIKTGNPVRQDLIEIDGKKDEAQHFFNIDKTKKTLLVLGGSLGAREMNKLIEREMQWLVEAQNMQIIWQTGKLYFKEYKKYNNTKNVKTYAFLNKMDLAFAAADVIISRAGAGSISELCIVAKPTIFIPSPNLAEDHQTKNALSIVSKNAAIMIKEKELERFQIVFTNLNKDQKLQENLSKNMRLLASPNATNLIVDEIEKLIKNKVN